jgi:MFS superfamily sulfate permease-like transporter
MNKFIKKLSIKIKRFRKNYDSNWNIFVVCIAIVMIWKWIWDLLDMYIFPGYPLISNLICIGIGIIVLLMDDWKLWELQEEDPHKEKNMK